MDAHQRDFSRIARDIQRLCYAGLDGESLRRAAVERLGNGLGFDAYCCFTIDPMSQLFTHAILGGERSQSDLDHFIERVYFEDEINQYSWMARARRPVALLSDSFAGNLDRSLCYREILRPHGHAHQARCIFMVKQELWGGIELTRDRKRADYDRDEVALLTQVAPHLGAGLKAAALRGLIKDEAPSVDMSADIPGMLTLDQRLHIVSCTSAAERWLRELGWPASDRGGVTRLPQPVLTLIRALKRIVAPETEADTLRVPRLNVQTPSGRWLSLVADTAITQGDTPPLTMVLIEPLGPRERGWLRRSAYALTPREEEVVQLVAQGLATREIATLLCVTDYTVQEHLSHIFDKVGVRGRRPLLKRLFLDGMRDMPPAPNRASD